jgi:heme O synthase-like polyprenyltransferase
VRPRDFIALMKPRVMMLAVFTALVGLADAPLKLRPLYALLAVLAIAAGAAPRASSICGTTPISTPS